MRFAEIAAPAARPHLVDLRLDPADVPELRRRLDDDEDGAARVLRVDRAGGDVWTVTVACASARVRDLLDSAWG